MYLECYYVDLFPSAGMLPTIRCRNDCRGIIHLTIRASNSNFLDYSLAHVCNE
jgi:hypothetical protein